MFGFPTPSRSTFSGQKAPGHPHSGCERILPQFLMDLGLHLEAISVPFWSHAGTLWAKVATQTPKKGVWREVQNQDPKKVHFGSSPQGVRRVHSCTIAQFPLFRPCPFWLHFWLHFGVILGAKFATILFFGRPGRQQPPPPKVDSCQCVLSLILGSGRGGAGQGWHPGETPGDPPENPPPPPHTTRARSDNLA